MNLFFLLLMICLTAIRINAQSEARDCSKNPIDSNNWFCLIKSNNKEVLKSNVTVQKFNRVITVQVNYTTHFLSSYSSIGTDTGRSDKWSTAGLETVIRDDWDTIKSKNHFTDVYKIENQKNAINTQCNEPQDQFKIDIKNIWYKKSSEYFARGHYTPNADFTTNEERLGTFHYFNAAPQWQVYNQGNWRNKVEIPIQNLNKRAKNVYQIYTGSYGQLPCPNKPNVGLYLQHSDPSAKFNVKIPIPLIFWKIIAPSGLRDSQIPIFIASSNHPTWTKPDIEKYLRENFCDPSVPSQDICHRFRENDEDLAWFREANFVCDKGTGSTKIDNGYINACIATETILNKLGVKLIRTKPVQGFFRQLFG